MRDCLDRGRHADTYDGGGAERTAYRKGCGHGRSSGDRGGDNLYAEKTTGTTSDLDGKFSFKVPDGTESVLFSSVGMKDVVYKIVPGKTDGITVVMEWESTQLDQVVVTGYAQTTVKG